MDSTEKPKSKPQPHPLEGAIYIMDGLYLLPNGEFIDV